MRKMWLGREIVVASFPPLDERIRRKGKKWEGWGDDMGRDSEG